MPERMHRTQVLLEPGQHRALAEIARHEGRSISDVVREMVRRELQAREEAASAGLERQLAALDRLRQRRSEVLARRGNQPIGLDVADLIRQMREERDADIIAGC